MMRRQPISERPATPCPYTTVFRYRDAVDPVRSTGIEHRADPARLRRGDARKAADARRGKGASPAGAAVGAAGRLHAAGDDRRADAAGGGAGGARHPRSEEHTSELQSLMRISYAVFCLKKNKH